MGDSKYWDQILKLPSVVAKKEYLKIVKQNLPKLKALKAPVGIKKVEKKTGHHVIRRKHPKEMIVGLAGSSLECIE